MRGPVIEIVKGSATPEEMAALVMALRARPSAGGRAHWPHRADFYDPRSWRAVGTG